MKIWIDLTDFLDWRGNLTGIQRIQYNISKLYIESGKDVHFFVYREHLRDFFEVEFNPDEIVKAGVIFDDNNDRLSNQDKSKREFIRLVRKIIPINISNKIKNSLSSNTVKDNTHYSCIFNRNDTVLVMGGVWVGNYIDDLEKCKHNIGFKLAHFVFDLIPSFYPGYVVEWLPSTFTAYNKKVFSMAECVIAISESTANDIRRFMKIHEIGNKPIINVVRIGEGINTGNKVQDKSLRDITGNNFILSVSTVEGRKNHMAFFYVIKEAKRRGIKLPKIVVVGRDGWLTDDFRYIVKHDVDAHDNILLLNNIDDAELSWLYKNCLFTVFPSFYEGWGMPIAESLSYGKLCLSSNTSSMPEIAGELIDYFSPYDTGEMLECMEKYLDKSERTKKEIEINQNYHLTSWVDMFNNIDKFINHLSKDK